MNIIEIKNTKYTAKINLSRGGNCISLYNAEWGAHILREPDYTNLDNPFLYGMPILFPVNRISGGKFTFEGREYHFPVNEPDTGCHLLFYKTTGQTPHQLLLEKRLMMAKELLAGSDMSLVNVAAESGFSSQSYFNAVFKKHCGMTPLAFRQEAFNRYRL